MPYKNKEDFKPNPRGYYDYSRVYEDLVNMPVQKIVKNYNGHLIFMSGREDTSMDKTRQWLSDQGVYYDWNSMKLFMRKKDDYRKDCIIKEEIFRQEILGKYYVKFLLDDRNQVVDMWRSLGLKVFQVAEGDF